MKLCTNICKRICADLYQIRFALCVLIPYCILTQLIFHTVCPFAIFFGFPCPACGLTRAGLLLLSGHFIAAAQTNLSIYLWFPVLLYLCCFRYVVGKQPPFTFPLLILTCFCTTIYYLYCILVHNMVDVPCNGLLPRMLTILQLTF